MAKKHDLAASMFAWNKHEQTAMHGGLIDQKADINHGHLSTGNYQQVDAHFLVPVSATATSSLQKAQNDDMASNKIRRPI